MQDAKAKAKALDAEVKAAKQAAIKAAAEGSKAQAALQAQRDAAAVHDGERADLLEAASMAQVGMGRDAVGGWHVLIGWRGARLSACSRVQASAVLLQRQEPCCCAWQEACRPP